MKDITFTITATMPEDWADYFCSFLKKMQVYGAIGHSGVLSFYADGDGDFRPKFEIEHEWNHVEPSTEQFSISIYDRG